MSSNPTIKSHQELLSLSGYEENLTITPLNFSKVIAEYEIRDAELKCCLTDEHGANSNMRCDSLKSLMIINKLSKFL